MRSSKERAERAQIFQSFDSLKGFKEYIRKKERIVVKRKQLANDYCEELDWKIHQIQVGNMIKVVYYDTAEYVEIKGMVSKIDLAYNKTITIVDQCVDIYNIAEIEIL